MKKQLTHLLCLSLLTSVLFLGTPCRGAQATGLMGWVGGFLTNATEKEAASDMTVQEAVQALQDAGLAVEAEEAYRLLEGGEGDCQPLYVLLALGLGEYDAEAHDLVPISHVVYAFDGEVFDVDTMYTTFLRGIQMIVPDITITNVVCEAQCASAHSRRTTRVAGVGSRVPAPSRRTTGAARLYGRFLLDGTD